jgi:hypothetical protein
MTKEQATIILNLANLNLSKHEEYESWMLFEGADILPTGQIIPRFKTKDGKSGFSEPKYLIYQEVWKGTVLELRL